MLGGQDIIISRPCPPLAASCRIPLAFRSSLSFLALPAIFLLAFLLSCIFSLYGWCYGLAAVWILLHLIGVDCLTFGTTVETLIYRS
ncbi:hypothetical protein Trisim1_008337 [Trichoderma cf. simile WF8]